MSKNAAAWTLGIIAYNDFVQNPEQKSTKKQLIEKTSLPDESKNLVYVSEVWDKLKVLG